MCAVAVSILKQPCGGFRCETATYIQKWFKILYQLEILESSACNM